MAIKICVSGITGWTGSAVARAVLDSPDFELVGGVSRSAAGQDAGHALGREAVGVGISASVADALEARPDVLVDYTHPGAVRGHVEAAVDAGVAVVVGTSGLTATDYGALDQRARDRGVGIVAAGNFSVTAALAKHFAGIAARHVPHWELIDYAHGTKPDAPSGTVRELAEFLGGVAENRVQVAPDEGLGPREARGATLGGAQVHSVRLPGFVVSFEALFGLPNERLSIRHDAGSGAEPYVGGTLLAARRALEHVGLVRGLDTLLFGDADTPSA
ncbi:MAG: 4-hydroxy-tetrahydrodipicolinate reductase [Longimicrobiales bacterium]